MRKDSRDSTGHPSSITRHPTPAIHPRTENKKPLPGEKWFLLDGIRPWTSAHWWKVAANSLLDFQSTTSTVRDIRSAPQHCT
ncbi:MAG: hypothetical protein EP346_04425 [Bacteroidetes bacterium]|nr:MAG: hypothetical protein EP346_04425 [Bacteroidota bacterium]